MPLRRRPILAPYVAELYVGDELIAVLDAEVLDGNVTITNIPRTIGLRIVLKPKRVRGSTDSRREGSG